MRKVSTISKCNYLTFHSSVGVESISNGSPEVYNVENIHPLLLSDNILQQCNIIFRDYLKFWHLVSNIKPGTEMDIDMNREYHIIDFMQPPIVKKITSLHQLQNIYFMLHGKEMDFDVDTIELKEEKSSAFSSN